MNEIRPRYFTERNAIDEQSIADEVARAWECHTEKLSDWAYRLDYAISNGWRTSMIGYAEIKNRPNTVFGKYSGYELSAHKIAFARLLREQSSNQLRTWAIVRFSDGLVYYAEFGKEKLRFILGGRKDRGTLGDIEPMGIIPWVNFKPITIAP